MVIRSQGALMFNTLTPVYPSVSMIPGWISAEHIGLLEQVSLFLLVAALVLSYIVVTRFDNPRSPFSTFRKRFVLGVPWGTVLIVAGLYFVYYVIQGANDPGGPNVVGFRSWSVWYPQSMLFSWFSHSGRSHLTGNVLGTVIFGVLVEYSWSHYPVRRGEQSFSSWKTNPFVRIGLFILGAIVVGLLGALLVPGAMIGFSGVVFALAGFAIITRPLLAAGGLLGLEALSLVYNGLRNPIRIVEADTQFVTPSWATTALQGHLFGLLVGVLLAVILLRYRPTSPKLRYIWFAALVFAATRSMWAIFWFLSATEFILFRGLGAAAVLVLASIVALAALPVDRSVLSRRLDVPLRSVAVTVLVGLVVLLAIAGVPYNLVGVSPGEETEGGLEIDDYTVTYAENVEDQYISIDLPVVGDLLSVESSGVIVTSDERNIWALDTPKDELALEGQSVTVVGDATWREVVIMNHTQWEVVGGNTTYKVFGQHWQVMDEQRLLYQADTAEADVTINGTRFGIRPAESFYEVVVLDGNETRQTEQIPSHNESVELAGVTFERDENVLTAVHERTEIRFGEYRVERD